MTLPWPVGQQSILTIVFFFAGAPYSTSGKVNAEGTEETFSSFLPVHGSFAALLL